nr:MAG TPA: hypothetical protein [Crassvirales sp.]
MKISYMDILLLFSVIQISIFHIFTFINVHFVTI